MNFAYKTKPYAHQQQIFERSADLEYFALFMEQGTGKTKVIIDTAAKAFVDLRISAVVVLAKKGMYGNWYYEEIPKHCPIPYRLYMWKGFYKEAERKEFVKACERGSLVFFIVNIEAVSTPKFRKVINEFCKVHRNFMLVCDESTTIKSSKAGRTQKAIKLSSSATMRRILSGLPNPQSPMDLFSQFQFLKPGVLGHSSFSSFKNAYQVIRMVHRGNRVFPEIIGYRDVEMLATKVRALAAIVKKDDCLDLPPKAYKVMQVELSERQRGYYDDLVKKAVTYIEDHEITAINALSLITRLLQICCGQIKTGDGKYVSIENNRIETLLDIIEETEGKLIVWTHYVRTAYDIMGRVGERGILLPGGLGPEEKQNRLHSFKTGKPKVLVANPASSGHGITLTEASVVVYYSNSYNLEHRLQSEDRSHRIGQTKSVQYIDMVAPDTIEGAVIQALKDKKNLSEQVINSKGLWNLIMADRVASSRPSDPGTESLRSAASPEPQDPGVTHHIGDTNEVPILSN